MVETTAAEVDKRKSCVVASECGVTRVTMITASYADDDTSVSLGRFKK